MLVNDMEQESQMTNSTKISIDAETLVKAIGERLERESSFLSPAPSCFITDPEGLLKLVEDAGVLPDQINRWIKEARGE